MDLSVVIVTHNHADYLPACLESLKPAMGHLQMEIFVVDNRSTDGSADLVDVHLPAARLIVNGRRRGFATNNNTGMRLAQGDFIVLLNPDTEVIAGALESLVSFLRAHHDVGLCGAQLRFPDGSVQPSCRRFPTVRSVIARRTPLRRYLKDSSFNHYHLMQDVDHTQPVEVDWMLGACLMTRRAALEDVGMMDEGYYLYVEDIDWAYRMRQRGWKVMYVPQAQMIHHHQAVTDRRWLTWRTWVHYRSMARFVRKRYLWPRQRDSVRPLEPRAVTDGSQTTAR
jgi:N-acetylglucosaminyl-diphospho-decaprenol L-rhamnosyltransferase